MNIPQNAQLKCSRCSRSTKAKRADGWNFDLRGGVVVEIICPSCQTAEENAEAEINEATLNYSVDAFGRFVGASKAVTA